MLGNAVGFSIFSVVPIGLTGPSSNDFGRDAGVDGVRLTVGFVSVTAIPAIIFDRESNTASTDIWSLRLEGTARDDFGLTDFTS